MFTAEFSNWNYKKIQLFYCFKKTKHQFFFFFESFFESGECFLVWNAASIFTVEIESVLSWNWKKNETESLLTIFFEDNVKIEKKSRKEERIARKKRNTIEFGWRDNLC